MTLDHLLAFLPPICALALFFANSLLRGRILNDQFVRDIATRLRDQGKIDSRTYHQMTATRLKATLGAQKALRDMLSTRDFELLAQRVKKERAYRALIGALLVAIVLFGLAVYLYFS
jgi:hypothetical protein